MANNKKTVSQVQKDHHSQQLNKHIGSSGSNKVNSQVHGNRSKQLTQNQQKDQ
ncbi:hypothetical protein [Neptuniibacter halophilus]|uniref:hypothetical protein n=1 Tax=Neptuniibacter halophilus TaxID=651666 RepID=UPI002572B416|nr:hypothetical protein [Neptuniibacter halophilus]